MNTTRRQLLAGIGGGIVTALAGCAASGHTPAELESESDLIDEIALQDGQLTVGFEDSPKADDEDCWFNPATKTTMCDHEAVPVSVREVRLAGDGVDATKRPENGTVTFDLGDPAGEYTVRVVVANDSRGEGVVELPVEIGGEGQLHAGEYDDVY